VKPSVGACTREIPAFKFNHLRIPEEFHGKELDVDGLFLPIARGAGSAAPAPA
jgi:hypothetical protein